VDRLLRVYQLFQADNLIRRLPANPWENSKMKNAYATLPALLAAALMLGACQSTPTADSKSAQPPKPAETKPESTERAFVPPGPRDAATPARPAAAAPRPESAPPAAAPASEAKAESMTIAEMQKRLTELGYNPGPADGAAGKRTTDALKKFQQANKLPATGTLDPETIRRLRSAKR
jgi:hypothetical protein